MALVLLGLGALVGFASGFREIRHDVQGHRGHPCYLGERSWLFEY
jgi:hypothetical protein